MMTQKHGTSEFSRRGYPLALPAGAYLFEFQFFRRFKKSFLRKELNVSDVGNY